MKIELIIEPTDSYRRTELTHLNLQNVKDEGNTNYNSNDKNKDLRKVIYYNW